ncbi:hypothetical protein [Paenibacillus elgii]|nr:hypothetical protein [Paenibacillus elgii]
MDKLQLEGPILIADDDASLVFDDNIYHPFNFIFERKDRRGI